MMLAIYLVAFGLTVSSQLPRTKGQVARNERYLLDSTPASWVSWEQYAACSITCVSGYEKETQNCCSTGNNMACLLLPWTILKPLVGTCPVDGQWSIWSAWSSCGTTCGITDMTRTRTCIFDAVSPKGQNCSGEVSESRICNQKSCAVDGVWQAWTSWSTCNATCAGGLQIRHRNCHYQPLTQHGKVCPGDNVQQQVCNSNLCPVDGKWATWSVWSSCSYTCGNGSKSRLRQCTFSRSAPHGMDCTGSARQEQTCNSGPCTFRSCQVCPDNPDLCEIYTTSTQCKSVDQQYCINVVDNHSDASRTVSRRCATQKECMDGWVTQYSSNHKCVAFNSNYIYTSNFYCEFCCTSDNCNKAINPTDKYIP